MTRVCNICNHPERADIERAMVQGEAGRSIASRFDGFSRSAVARHASEHLPESLVKSHEAEEIGDADRLMREIRRLQVRAIAILDAAEEDRERDTALRAIREARATLELQAKIAQIISDAPRVNVLVSPQWVELRTVIVGALDDFPEAKRAVLAAIGRRGGGDA